MFERSYLQNIIVNAPVGIITTDMNLKVTFISESAKSALGLGDSTHHNANASADDIPSPDIGFESITRLTPDPGEIHRHLDPVLKQETDTRSFELDIQAGEASRTVQFTSSLLRDDDYIPIGFLLMCQDVTRQRETDKKYRNLMENSIDAVFIYKGASVLEVNPAFTVLTGKTLSTQTILAWDDFIHTDSIQQVLDYAHRREEGDETVPHKFDCYGLGADGSKRYWSLSISPIYPKLGIYSALIHDQTEQKLLEQQLIHTRKMETVSLLAGGIAHDFNNILTGVLGYSSLVKTLLNPEDTVYNFVDSIESSALHAKKLNDQLVAFARLGKYNVAPINLNEVAAQTLRLLRISLDKSIDVKMDLSPGLSSIDANATQIQQLITNICINASEAMPGGGTLSIATTNLHLDEKRVMGEWAVPSGEYAHMTISDTGHGIQPDMLNKIFEPFTSTKGVGFGLGLAAAYGIVKSHHGFISADSSPEQGTRIDLYFPAAICREKPGKKPAASTPAGRGSILIVDDEQIVRDILGEILKELGYHTTTADDGEQAITIYGEQAHAIDAVFLDMIMPGMNGEETFQELKKVNPDVRVIVCTGYTDEGPLREMMRRGALGVIKKPFRMDDIASVLAEVLCPAQQQHE